MPNIPVGRGRVGAASHQVVDHDRGIGPGAPENARADVCDQGRRGGGGHVHQRTDARGRPGSRDRDRREGGSRQELDRFGQRRRGGAGRLGQSRQGDLDPVVVAGSRAREDVRERIAAGQNRPRRHGDRLLIGVEPGGAQREAAPEAAAQVVHLLRLFCVQVGQGRHAESVPYAVATGRRAAPMLRPSATPPTMKTPPTICSGPMCSPSSSAAKRRAQERLQVHEQRRPRRRRRGAARRSRGRW